MPKLTDHTYLLQRTDLRGHWLDEPCRAFFLLGASEQWALHVYYLPSITLSDRTLLEHRQDISTYDPTLPQRAGRALGRFRVMERQLQMYREAPKPLRKKGAQYELRIFSEVHPTIDVAKFAAILTNHQARESDPGA